MKIRFTHHALSQALARGIAESRIIEVVRHSDSESPGLGGARISFANWQTKGS